jgi:hypothetical protein
MSNPSKKFLEKNKKYGNGFSASLMDGPSVDFFEIADIERTDGVIDAVWRNHNWRSLLEECGSAEIIPVIEYDLAPGQSDISFFVAIDNPEKFKRELRKVILDLYEKSI